MSDNTEIVKTGDSKLDLSKMHELDFSNLDEDQQKHVMQKFTDAQVELAKTAHQAKIDIHATKSTLNDIADAVKDASSDGTSATITHSQTTSLGRTEIVMGNTERAAKGKISRSGTGQDDNTMKIVIVVGIVAILIALIISN